MDAIKLKARFRDGRGKSYTRKARVDGWIPAVFYGEGMESKAIEVDNREFAKIVRDKNTTHLIELDLEGEGDATSIIKEIQRHPFVDAKFIHIDFQHIERGHKITLDIELKLIGVCKGVKEDGGILSQPVHKVTVECLPSHIPDHLELDITELRANEALHAKDINIENITVLDSPDEVIASVTLPKAETAEVESEGAAEGEATTD